MLYDHLGKIPNDRTTIINNNIKFIFIRTQAYAMLIIGEKKEYMKIHQV